MHAMEVSVKLLAEMIAPSRLHFGLYGFGSPERRQFGGVGAMIDSPQTHLQAWSTAAFQASGPLAETHTPASQVSASRRSDETKPKAEPACHAPHPTATAKDRHRHPANSETLPRPSGQAILTRRMPPQVRPCLVPMILCSMILPFCLGKIMGHRIMKALGDRHADAVFGWCGLVFLDGFGQQRA